MKWWKWLLLGFGAILVYRCFMSTKGSNMGSTTNPMLPNTAA